MDSPFIWHELSTPDVDASKKFYNAVFGWTTDPMPMNDMGFTYHLIKGDADPFGGMMPTNIPSMEGTPPHWAMYLHVGDVDATVASVKANGGSCHVEPMDVPMAGRMALVADPQGASFWVMTPAPMPQG
jgi:predicted enzyme related to lactoylglutathione lyase